MTCFSCTLCIFLATALAIVARHSQPHWFGAGTA